MKKIVLWNNLWTRNLYLYILNKSAEHFTAIQDLLRVWGGALETVIIENIALINERYPQLTIPVTLESVFALRNTGQEDKERWFDGYEVSIE